MLAALLLLAPLALAQFSGPPMQCLASCMDLADVYAKCAPLASEQAAFADCVKPLCSGSDRTNLEKCIKCTADANGEPIDAYWASFDEVCKTAGVDVAAAGASGGASAAAAPVLPALAGLALAAIVF